MVKALTRSSQTLGTYYAPPDEVYAKELFEGYVDEIVAILRPKEWSAVSEPFPESEIERKSFWHFHLSLWYGEGVRKQITASMQKKVEKVLSVPLCTHDYTATLKGIAGQQKMVNDMNYAMGGSTKRVLKGKEFIQKEKHDVYKSPGFDSVVQERILKLASLKKDKEDLGGFDPCLPAEHAYALMKNKGWKPFEIWTFAEETENLKLELYVAKNMTALEELYSNVVKMKALRAMKAKPLPEPNNMQVECKKIIASSMEAQKEPLTFRGKGQLNVFVDKKGNAGKSVMQDMLYREYDAPEFPNVKTADVATAYNYQKMVNFNFARSTAMDKVNYRVIEDLADGKIFSSKYHSGMKRVCPPQINIFANNMPQVASLSEDRWNIYEWDSIIKKFKKLSVKDGELYETNYEPPAFASNSRVILHGDRQFIDKNPFSSKKRRRVQTD